MGRRFLKLSATGAALTLNGLRPLPGSNPLSVPSFFGGWLTSELAPHNLAITVAGTSGYLARKRRRGLDRDDWIALGLNAVSIAGLAVLIRQGVKSGEVVEAALTEGLADDYVAKLDPAPARKDLATPWRHVLLPFRFKDERVRRFPDIPYTPDPPADRKAARRLLLDIYTSREPAAPGERRPVLFQIHGGGWVIGKKDEQGLPLMTHLAARGWVCVAPNYPLSPKATWPEHLIALKRALAWTKDNIADYGGDPSFIAVTGGSAGGHLASLVALTADDPSYQPGFETADTSVQACVPFYGAYDLANVLESKAGDQRLDYFLARTVFKTKDRAVFESATPILRVREDAPPFFVIHGAHDSLAPVEEARELVRRLREVNKEPVVYAELPGAQHAFDVFHSIRSAHVIRAAERFLRWVHADHVNVAASTRSDAQQHLG
ncbi:MAG: alpha/beta hydrolase [Frankiales bacterium]|nr:alpha/beta hydrolase [Frankiales bacterium]